MQHKEIFHRLHSLNPDIQLPILELLHNDIEKINIFIEDLLCVYLKSDDSVISKIDDILTPVLNLLENSLFNILTKNNDLIIDSFETKSIAANFFIKIKPLCISKFKLILSSSDIQTSLSAINCLGLLEINEIDLLKDEIITLVSKRNNNDIIKCIYISIFCTKFPIHKINPNGTLNFLINLFNTFNINFKKEIISRIGNNNILLQT